MERIENSETDPSIHGTSIYNKTGIVNHWGKGRVGFSVYQVGAGDCSYERAYCWIPMSYHRQDGKW